MDGGGAHKFFRIEFGLGDKDSSDPKKRLPDFEHYTNLSREVKISVEYLHKPHSYFKSLSKEDQLKLLFFEEWERRKSIKEYKDIKNK